MWPELERLLGVVRVLTYHMNYRCTHSDLTIDYSSFVIALIIGSRRYRSNMNEPPRFVLILKAGRGGAILPDSRPTEDPCFVLFVISLNMREFLRGFICKHFCCVGEITFILNIHN